MQSKFEFLGQLPQDLVPEIASHLPTPVLISLSKTTEGHCAFFKPILEDRKVLQKFLHHVVRGEHDAVQEMLKNDINLLFKRDQVTDRSGRTFEFISGIEYALWALDKHMWTTMLDCIPKNEEGKKVLQILSSQYDKVKTEGVTYRLNGKTITENHFDFINTIINELQKIHELQMRTVDPIHPEVIASQWVKDVGSAQKLLPMHAVYECCSSEPSNPVPNFASPPKSSMQFYNFITKKNENWFGVNSGLAVIVAIYKSLRQGLIVAAGVKHCGFIWLDLQFMKGLHAVRTKDFIELESQIEKQMTVDDQPPVSQM